MLRVTRLCDIIWCMSDPNLRAMLGIVDGKLAMSLANSRASFRHATLRGDGAEYALRDALNQHIPRNFTIGTGEAIDLYDARTGQIDVIIANEAQPFRTGTHDSGLYLFEGISAAGEVKANLTVHRLQLAIGAAAEFKKLRASSRGSSYYSMGSDEARFLDSRPYFLFAFESRVSSSRLLDELNAGAAVAILSEPSSRIAALDAVFILGKGVAINCGDGAGVLQYRHDSGPLEGQPAEGWIWLGRANGIFTYFLLWLASVMPRMEYATPIATDYLSRVISSSDRSVRGPFAG